MSEFLRFAAGYVAGCVLTIATVGGIWSFLHRVRMYRRDHQRPLDSSVGWQAAFEEYRNRPWWEKFLT